jgi:hypothetical protein
VPTSHGTQVGKRVRVELADGKAVWRDVRDVRPAEGAAAGGAASAGGGRRGR